MERSISEIIQISINGHVLEGVSEAALNFTDAIEHFNCKSAPFVYIDEASDTDETVFQVLERKQNIEKEVKCVVLEEKCKVCGEWVDAEYWHNTCYRTSDAPRSLPDYSNEIPNE